MLDKYFGFTKIDNELSVIESLLEHTRIDEAEIILLKDMIEHLFNNDSQNVTALFKKIKKINADSSRTFETTAEQIIQADFDQQKQYDLLRLFQRIESISGAIISAAKRVIILNHLNVPFPKELLPQTKQMMSATLEIHDVFQKALVTYQEDRGNLIRMIHHVVELENNIDNIKITCLETLYKLGNSQSIPIGTFRALENMIEHIEELSDAIEEAATSLEWLLIY